MWALQPLTVLKAAANPAQSLTGHMLQLLIPRHNCGRYRDLDRCVTEEEKEYHQLVVKQLARNPRGSRLYTYVDEDDYSTLHEVCLLPFPSLAQPPPSLDLSPS